MLKFYKKIKGEEIFVKSIDNNNNYSIFSNLDPEPEGYIDHQWGIDIAEWVEIDKQEAEEILGYDLA